jgi:hypothetical protein
VATLEDAIATLPNQPTVSKRTVVPDNPVYIQKQVQLEGAQIELRAALAKNNDLRAKMADFEKRLMGAPEVERAFRELSRGYEELVAEYANIQQKQREAQLAFNLESSAMGERFRLLESPLLARLPARPNRIAVLFLSFLLALAGGIAALAIAESSDTRVRGVRDVIELLEVPPLAVVPYIPNSADLRAWTLRRSVVVISVLIWLAVLGSLIFGRVAEFTA